MCTLLSMVTFKIAEKATNHKAGQETLAVQFSSSLSLPYTFSYVSVSLGRCGSWHFLQVASMVPQKMLWCSGAITSRDFDWEHGCGGVSYKGCKVLS